MKRIIRTGVVVAMMLMGVSTYAKGSEPFVKVSAAGNKEFTLFINEVNAPAVVVSLKDISGNILYNEVLLSKDKYHKLYDLNALPIGSYTLEIDEDTRINTWAVELTSEGITMNLSAKKEFFKPQIVKKDNVLGISFFNRQLESLHISVFNDQNEEVFTEELAKELVLMKQYDLSRFDMGRYTVITSTPERTFNEVIYVN